MLKPLGKIGWEQDNQRASSCLPRDCLFMHQELVTALENTCRQHHSPEPEANLPRRMGQWGVSGETGWVHTLQGTSLPAKQQPLSLVRKKQSEIHESVDNLQILPERCECQERQRWRGCPRKRLERRGGFNETGDTWLHVDWNKMPAKNFNRATNEIQM